jgi:di/tricarboxylate transporter
MKSFSIEMKGGIQFSILSLVWMILEKTLGWHDQYIDKQPIYTNLFGIIAIGIYFLALLDKKKNYFKGQMDWKQGFVSGIVLSFVISLLSPLVQYVTYSYITPHFFTNIIHYAVSHKIQTQVQAETIFSLKSYILQGIFGGLSMGVLTAALVALVVKTKNIPNEK